jgi:hypothetical protein
VIPKEVEVGVGVVVSELRADEAKSTGIGRDEIFG